MTDPLSKILFLARFLCFMAVVYLALHKLAARLSQNPNSKLTWFFGVLTAPLTIPVRLLCRTTGTEDQLLTRALFFYLILWLGFVVLGSAAGTGR